jgi:hypothetical protein
MSAAPDLPDAAREVQRKQMPRWTRKTRRRKRCRIVAQLAMPGDRVPKTCKSRQYFGRLDGRLITSSELSGAGARDG